MCVQRKGLRYSHLQRCSLLIVALIHLAAGVIEHRTQAAAERSKELKCFQCDTMTFGERCVEPFANDTSLLTQCYDERKICMVRRFSLQTSTENGTTGPSLWLLQRNCTKHCEPGCIIIGERTKLHACTTCCEKDLCNFGSSTTILQPLPTTISIALLLTTTIRPP